MTDLPKQSVPTSSHEKRPTYWDYAKLLLGLAATACFFGMLAFKHPSDYGVIPSCPFHTGTGILCPGCGSMRATHFFITGHWLVSLRYNPLVLVMLPVIVYVSLQWFFEIFLHHELPFPHQATVYRVVAVIFIVFFIMRNIPLDCFEILRPPPQHAAVLLNLLIC